MPYFITDSSADCSGWAVVKDDGEVMGCHQTKAEAVDQMVAISLEEGIEPGGERSVRALPDNYRPAVSEDVPEGRACGNCLHYDETMINDDGVQVWCHLWADWVRGDYYCNRWEPAARYGKDDDDDEERQVNLNVPVYIRNAASRGLELREEGYGGDGLVPRTIREARLMASGEISEDKVIRANAWAERHAVDLDAPQNSDADNDDWPGNGAVAHYLWGINPLNPGPARDWFARKAEEIKNERSDMTMEDQEFRFEAPRDNVVRQVEFRAKQSSDGLTLEGYAAVFNEWTEIDSYEGTFMERIAPGAFKRTIGMRTPVLQFDHGTHPLIGSIPLGRITSIAEDSHGLRIKARLSDNWLVEPVRDAIRDGAIQGMSFRFRVVDEKWVRGKNGAERTITEIELLEAGPVVFPAYEKTSVGVRSREIISSLENPEIRSEIAKILAMGTDITSLASTDDPVKDHSSVSDASADSHAKVRSKTQRQAIARLTLEKDNHENG